MKWLRLVLVILALGLFAYGLFVEPHKMLSINETEPPQELSGAAFSEMTTYDGLMLVDGRLCDVYSLGPEGQEKYCAT